MELYVHDLNALSRCDTWCVEYMPRTYSYSFRQFTSVDCKGDSDYLG